MNTGVLDVDGKKYSRVLVSKQFVLQQEIERTDSEEMKSGFDVSSIHVIEAPGNGRSISVLGQQREKMEGTSFRAFSSSCKKITAGLSVKLFPKQVLNMCTYS